MGNNYQRLFYIFKNMDNNLGTPTGYIKVEINGQTAKLQISLNNLSDRPGIKYQLYGVCKEEQKLDYTSVCDIQNTNGRADIKLTLDSLSIGSNHLSFDDINIFAVIAQLPDRSGSVCPLVAYKRGELQWKREFEAALRKSERQADTKDSDRKDESRIETNAAEPVRSTEIVYMDEREPLQSLLTEEILERENVEEEIVGDLSDLIEVSEEGSNNKANEVLNNISAHTAGEYNEIRELSNAPLDTPEVDTPESGSLDSRESPNSGLREVLSQTENNFKLDTRDITSKFEATLTSIYSREHDNQPLTDPHLDTLSAAKSGPTADNVAHTPDSDTLTSENDIIGSAERNFREISEINTEGDKFRNDLDIESLRDELDKSFEACNPFNNKSKRFRWWKINSPGYLNNILFRNNVKTYLLFNPKVMMAHYKYRYIIFGIRYDKYSGRERFICGVPGVYSIDENPFGNMGSWAQLEGYKPKYGSFGYWIILIDPRTGKLLKIK